jgi:periplasmic protein TonB
LSFLDITPYKRREERISIPITLLQFGSNTTETGNVKTPASGNLTDEGAPKQAPISPEPLEDARTNASQLPRADATVKQTIEAHTSPKEYVQPSFVKPVKEKVEETKEVVSSVRTNKSANDVPSNTSDIGALQPSTAADPEGLGRFGSGAGRGAGFNLEWGGGGNRVVMHKELPKYPSGVNTSAQIKIRFTVLKNGSVGVILPMQKGEPALERAAMEALRRWQFNPSTDDKDMVGFITFTFRVQ